MVFLFDSHPSLLIDLEALKGAKEMDLIVPVLAPCSRAPGQSNRVVYFVIIFISLTPDVRPDNQQSLASRCGHERI